MITVSVLEKTVPTLHACGSVRLIVQSVHDLRRFTKLIMCMKEPDWSTNCKCRNYHPVEMTPLSALC